MIARIGSRRWVVSLAALTAITALSIDMSLPAQPTLERAFAVTPEKIQLTLSLFLVGFALGQLATGYLSDARGRRTVLIAALATYTLAGVACALADGVDMLLVFRFAQGLAAGAAPTIARAMVRDTYDARNAAQVLSTMVAVLAVAPMVAPLIGGLVLHRLGWRAIFATLALLGVAFTALASLTLAETLPVDRRAQLSVRAIAAGFARFFRTPGTLLPSAIGCATFAGQFAFISDSPFVLINHFGVAPGRYGLYFGATALALMGGATWSSRLLRGGREPHRVLGAGGVALLVGALLVAAGTQLERFGVIAFIGPMIVYFVGLGLAGPSAVAIAMDPVPQIAGTASSLIGCAQMISGALSGYVATRVAGADPRKLGMIVATLGSIGAVLALVVSARTRAVRAARRL
ncbi:MAG: bcr 1 [Myxococcales bacterium]|nr:bcr 1 [Myxococcales bacterium]